MPSFLSFDQFNETAAKAIVDEIKKTGYVVVVNTSDAPNSILLLRHSPGLFTDPHCST